LILKAMTVGHVVLGFCNKKNRKLLESPVGVIKD
jgi:hypothetical protein